MKSDVENLSETRVKFTVELPFDDLGAAIDEAYKRIAGQVNIPGFRKGHVPRQVIDQRFGRGVVLEEVVQATVPQAYDDVIRESGVHALGQPQVEVTDIVDGEHIAFTAEVDVRPEFELPQYKGLHVEVDPLEVTDADVEEQLTTLAARFGSYKEVERATAEGDVLLIDVSGELDGEALEDLSQSAASYEVGKDGLVPGLDEAVVGLSSGETATFEFVPEFGEYAGRTIVMTVNVTAVRERMLPELDDDLAMMASEFDTLDELRADLRTRLERARLYERGADARTKLHDQLLDSVEIPLPEGLIEAEVNQHFEGHGGDHGHEENDEAHRVEVEENARKSLKSQFVMDRIAEAEDVSVGEAELSQWLMMQAPQYGMAPDQFAQALVEAGQVPMAVADVRRGKALALVLEHAEIVDTNGQVIDIKELDRALQAADEERQEDSIAELMSEIDEDSSLESEIEAQMAGADDAELVRDEVEDAAALAAAEAADSAEEAAVEVVAAAQEAAAEEEVAEEAQAIADDAADSDEGKQQ